MNFLMPQASVEIDRAEPQRRKVMAEMPEIVDRYLSAAPPARLGRIFEDSELAAEIVAQADRADRSDLAAALVSLAAHGTNEALLALQQARGRMPELLQDALAAALAECQLRHFQDRVDSFTRQMPDHVETIRSPAEAREVLEAVVADLAEYGVQVELPKGMPAVLQSFFAAGVLNLAEQYDFGPDARLVVDGCTGDCDPCFQADYCPVFLLVNRLSTEEIRLPPMPENDDDERFAA